MISLPTYSKTDERFRQFGSVAMPLRPSSLHRLVACPMSAFLTWSPPGENSLGGKSAQTGNLVHAAVKIYHQTAGDVRAGAEALAAARAEFPDGDVKEAEKIFAAYVADPKNQAAQVVWAEQPVRVEIEAAPGDPTGEPIIVEGTLDQVRRDADGFPGLSVWDVKTGDYLSSTEIVDEHRVQQACYVLAARETLDPSIVPGGIIYTPAYAKARGRVFLPLKMTVETCRMLLLNVAHSVSLIRRGVPLYRPSADACRWCPVRPYEQCSSQFHGAYA